MKPKIFVASSVEGLNVAYPIQVNLEHDADITIWAQGVFSLSTTPLDSIVNALNSADFGIFVFSPDDEIKMRGAAKSAVRDNVLFELGLFIGKLGKARCFIVMPSNVDFHIPSDLMGVTPATYSSERDVSEIQAALGPACHQIRNAIKLHGRYSGQSKLTAKIPANESDRYDENDKIILLDSWLSDNWGGGNSAIKFEDVDHELKLEPGTSYRLLPGIINQAQGFTLLKMGSNVFSFSYTSPGWAGY